MAYSLAMEINQNLVRDHLHLDAKVWVMLRELIRTDGSAWLEASISKAYRSRQAKAAGKIDARGRPRVWEAYVSEVIRLASEDKTVKQIATELQIGEWIVRRCCQSARVKPNRGYAGRGDDQRVEEMVSMFRSGMTLQEVGTHFSVSRERVRQILQIAGVSSSVGGRAKKGADAEAKRLKQRDAQSMKKHGMPWAEYAKHRGKKTMVAYVRQKNSARQRGIPFELTFAEWLSIWEQSGKLSQRGIGKDCYVMTRKGDSGGYSVGNVVIATSQENGREAVAQWLGKPKKKNPGVFCLFPGTSRPWVPIYSKKRLGSYATEEEAVAARDAYLASAPEKMKASRGYAIIKRNGKAYRYQVMVGSHYVGSYKSPEEALAARAAYLANKEQSA